MTKPETSRMALVTSKMALSPLRPAALRHLLQAADQIFETLQDSHRQGNLSSFATQLTSWKLRVTLGRWVWGLRRLG